MIRKIGVLSISLLCFAALISCEKDFSDVGSNVVNNTKFETGEILLDVEIEEIDLESVQADNIGIGTLGEYWLGSYESGKYKKVEASIISQLGFLSNLRNKENVIDGDTIFNLDKVILKIPYPATFKERNADGTPRYVLDSILGSPLNDTYVNVFENETFLNTLDPNDPAKQNNYPSDFPYQEGDDLSENTPFSFKPKATDTVFVFKRIDRSVSLTNTTMYDDETKIIATNKLAVPFLAVPLNLSKMKALFWDEFEESDFETKEAFDIYFRGLIIKASGTNGSLVPFNLSSSPAAVLDFHYTKSVVDGTIVKDTLQEKYSFPLSGIRNSTYKMSAATTQAPANNFVVQGTAGTMAKIKILDNTKLQELKDNNWLVNGASLTFYVNKTVDADKNIIPQRLFVYESKNNGTGGFSPTQLTDSYQEAATFGGVLELDEDDKPEKYEFGITDYISNLLDGTINEPSDLILKVYNNPTDNAVNNNVLTTKVSTRNWNPRGVTLYNGDKVNNGEKRAVLKISYSKEK